MGRNANRERVADRFDGQPSRLKCTRAVLAVIAGFAMFGLSAVAGSASPAVAATGGCRPVSGGAFVAGGQHQATVVVDTGSGPVWSACISFNGSVSGTEALDLAARIIPGLDPVYDIYAGQGRAVCRLLGVGNQPPNCLGKSVEYWTYFRDGAYARGGAGSATVRDGDVEGWRWGRGKPPRRATAGTEAVAAPPPATPTTTSAPTRPTTAPGPVGTAPAGDPGMADPPEGGQVPGASSTTEPRSPSGDPHSSSLTATTAPGSSSPASDSEPQPGVDPASGASNASAGQTAQAGQAAGGQAVGGETASSVTKGSSVGSVAGFVAALALVAGAGIWIRRRRTT